MRIRPADHGAIKMMPQVRYQGCTTGPRRTNISMEIPERVEHAHARRLCMQAVAGDAGGRQQPESRVTVSTPPRPTPMSTTWRPR